MARSIRSPRITLATPVTRNAVSSATAPAGSSPGISSESTSSPVQVSSAVLAPSNASLAGTGRRRSRRVAPALLIMAPAICPIIRSAGVANQSPTTTTSSFRENSGASSRNSSRIVHSGTTAEASSTAHSGRRKGAPTGWMRVPKANQSTAATAPMARLSSAMRPGGPSRSRAAGTRRPSPNRRCCVRLAPPARSDLASRCIGRSGRRLHPGRRGPTRRGRGSRRCPRRPCRRRRTS